MKSVALSEARDRLSALVDEAERELQIMRITRQGRGAAVLMAGDYLESLRETLFWLSEPCVLDDVDGARRAAAEGATTSGDDLLARSGLPAR